MEKIKSLLKNKYAKLAGIAAVIVLVMVLFLTVSLLNKRTDNRSRAAANPAVFSFEPSAVNQKQGEQFVVNLNLDPDGQAITAVDFTISYDLQVLELVGFFPGNAFNTILTTGADPSTTQMVGVYKTYRFAAVDTTGKAATGKIPLGRFVFKGITGGSGSIHIVKSVVTDLNTITNSLADAVINYTITDSLPQTQNQTQTIPTWGQRISPTPTPAPQYGNYKLTSYDLIVACIYKKPICTPDIQKNADLNLDGIVDETDVNLYYRLANSRN